MHILLDFIIGALSDAQLTRARIGPFHNSLFLAIFGHFTCFSDSVNLLIQPEAGIAQLVSAIRTAKKRALRSLFSVSTAAEIEAALKAAVARGVSVSALIAYTNRGGEIGLRKLEMRLLEVGVTVSRTANDLLRYHDKLMIIDRRVLYVMSFNSPTLISTTAAALVSSPEMSGCVQEAVKLFEADAARQPYTPKLDSFVVSPDNARKVLAAFLRKATKDTHLSPADLRSEMLRVLRIG